MKWSDNKETILKGVSELRFLHVVVFLWGCFFVGLFFFYIKHFFPKCTYNILTGYKAGVLEHMKRSLIGTTIT